MNFEEIDNPILGLSQLKTGLEIIEDKQGINLYEQIERFNNKNDRYKKFII